MGQSGAVKVDLTSILTSALDLATAQAALTYLKSIALTDGTGADQADQVWHDQRTLGASATENLDLAGSLTNALGATVTFARVKAILVFAAVGNTNNVQVGGAASNGFINWVASATDIINVRPGGLFLLVARDATAYAVTAGTGDILKMTNSSGSTSVTYDIILIGATA
ncbi:MAG: hypothetical protein A2Z31_00225 [candidate division NC10 bacterium RBG_16_65_8]|nr:MAG: hypothetical protein A2Z31_00225 [candidate division NC10 bacterium RBG_16_65_8]